MNLAQYLATYGAKKQAPKPQRSARSTSAPVVPSSAVKRQGRLWGAVNGYDLDPDLQDALAVWWYARPPELAKRLRPTQTSDADLREALEISHKGTNQIWASDAEGNRVSVSLDVSARGLTVSIGLGRKRRTLSPARVLSLVRDMLDLPA